VTAVKRKSKNKKRKFLYLAQAFNSHCAAFNVTAEVFIAWYFTRLLRTLP